MNRNTNMRSFSSPSAATARSAWQKPALLRLEAGAAEAATRQVIGDGPLGSKS